MKHTLLSTKLNIYMFMLNLPESISHIHKNNSAPLLENLNTVDYDLVGFKDPTGHRL